MEVLRHVVKRVRRIENGGLANRMLAPVFGNAATQGIHRCRVKEQLFVIKAAYFLHLFTL